MVADKKHDDPFFLIRKQVQELIAQKYPTVEKFAYENDIPKSTLSRFLNGVRKEYSVVTLARIAKALGKKLILKIDE